MFASFCQHRESKTRVGGVQIHFRPSGTARWMVNKARRWYVRLQQFPTLPISLSARCPLHELRNSLHEKHRSAADVDGAVTLPTAVFPQYPELFHDLDEQVSPRMNSSPDRQRHWPASKVMKDHAGLDVSVFQVTICRRVFSRSLPTSSHRMEMQSGLPLLLVV